MEPLAPPQDIEAETCVLGSILLDPAQLPNVRAVLQPTDFYRPAHADIYRACLAIADRHDPLDLVSLRVEMDRADTLDRVGGPEALALLLETVPAASNAVYYAKLVLTARVKRDLFALGHDLQRPADPAEAIADARAALLAAEPREEGGLEPIAGPVREALGCLQDRDNSRSTPTGLADLDSCLCGLHRGEMLVVAGRPSMGKTSLALRIAEHVAVDLGKGVAIFSLEVAAPQLALQMLCSRARVSLHLLRKGIGSEHDYTKLMLASGPFRDAPLFIDRAAHLTPARIVARVHALQTRQPLALVVVDYLQLLDTDGRRENRQAEVAACSRALKTLAVEEDVCVLAVAQLNRGAEARGENLPKLSDLRDSGSIEQDADAVILLYRANYYDDKAPIGEAQAIVAKQRHGPTGTVPLTWLPAYARFENAASASRGVGNSQEGPR